VAVARPPARAGPGHPGRRRAGPRPAHRPTGSAAIDVTELTLSAVGGVGKAIAQRALDDVVAAASRCYDAVESKPETLRATVTLKFQVTYPLKFRTEKPGK
jgi:hypothetical protein